LSSLGEELPKECARVRELIALYRDPMLAGAGEFAAQMMELALKKADVCMIEGDVVGMIRSYEDLKEFSL